MEEFRRLSKAEFSEVVLKEFVGHTMSQVIVGVFIGFINAFVMYRFLF
jgi:acid phosphatase family membrane protein YuiD